MCITQTNNGNNENSSTTNNNKENQKPQQSQQQLNLSQQVLQQHMIYRIQQMKAQQLANYLYS